MLRRIEQVFTSNFDWSLLVGMLMMCTIGLVVLYSAGYNPELNTSVQMNRQLVYVGGGVIAFFAAVLVSLNFWRRYAFFFYALGCLLLVAVIITGVVAGGARSWFDFGMIRMQPSEFMKIGIILAFARILSSEDAPAQGYSFANLPVPALVILLPVGLTLLQPDLGTAMIQTLIAGSMLFLAGIKRRTILTVVLLAAVAAYPAWTMLKPYQKDRITNFLSPESDPLDSGYNALQSKIAVGSGALTGKGFLKGTQTQLRFLPEQTTDFIFSVLAEEWGFVGTVFTLMLYAFLLSRIMRICSRAPDKFAAYICFGVAAMIFWQVIINIGMVVGVLPVVGVTLPLLSYGGSSIITVMVALGLVAGISIRRFLFT